MRRSGADDRVLDGSTRLSHVPAAGRLRSIYGFAARADFAAAIVALLGVLIFDTLPGLVIGISLSMLLLLARASRPNVATLGQLGGAWVDEERQPAATAPSGVATATDC